MKLILRILSALVITASVLLVALLLLPGEKVANLAADQIEAQTGRKLTFGGKVSFTFWPVLGVKSDRVAFSNADWAGPEPLLTAERLTIGISGADLLRGKLRVTEVSAVLPHLNLSEREDGLGNWVLDGAESATQADAPAVAPENQEAVLPISIERLTLLGASLKYSPHGGDPIEMSQVDLALEWPDPSGTVNLDLTVRPAGEPIQIKAELGTFAAFLGGAVSSVGASVEAEGGWLRFDGRADLSGDASGRVTVKTTDTATLLAGLGQGALEIPNGLGEALTLGADATYTADGRLALRDAELDLDGNVLTGALDVALGAVPQFTAQFDAGDLSFPGLTAGGTAADEDGTDGAAQDGWSQAPIDASALALANGTASLSFDSLSAAGYDLGPSQLSFTLERSRGVLKLQPAALFGGQVQGQLVANNRNGFSTGGKLTYNGIRLEQALGQTAGYDRLNGEALGEVEFLASGNSQDALMRSLSGKGWVEIGKGFFSGFDLEALMRTGQGNGGSTVFDQLSASYTIAQGNLQNEDLLVLLKGFRADGAGRIGLGARDLDYRFTPTLSGFNGGAGLSIPVAITGPWSDPKIRPDFENALQQEIDQVEQEAKDRLRQKLSEELETEITPEVDMNQVIRDRIEQEAKDQLLRLLGAD